MEQALFYVAILMTVGMAAFAIHIWRNPVLQKHNRIFLMLAAISQIVLLLTEGFSLCMEGHPEYNTVYTVNLSVCMIAGIWIVPCQLLGFSFPRVGRVASWVGAVYTVLFLATAPFGLVFYISSEGVYQLGEWSVLLIILVLL